MHYQVKNNGAALHILSPCPHHNVPLIALLSELNAHIKNEYVILDKKESFEFYTKLELKAKELFTSNSELLPWLRVHYLQYSSIVIHGFFNQVLWELLEENINITRKCIWVVYGGDLCEHQKLSTDPSAELQMQRMRNIVPELKKVLTFTQDEDDILSELYGDNYRVSKYMYHQSYIGSPAYKPNNKLKFFVESGLKTAVIGNSGGITSRHIQILEKLANQEFPGQVLLPLSYGLSDIYHEELKIACQKYFPGRYFLLTDLLSNDDYFSVLKKCDFFFMGHLRQQAGQHWMFAFFHNKPIYGAPNTPFVNTLNEKGIFWGNIDNISFDESYLKNFTANHVLYEKHYGLQTVKKLWLEALDVKL